MTSSDNMRVGRNAAHRQDTAEASRVQANGLTVAFESFGAVEAEPFLLISGLGLTS
jgi:hypothetical protein